MPPLWFGTIWLIENNDPITRLGQLVGPESALRHAGSLHAAGWASGVRLEPQAMQFNLWEDTTSSTG